MKSCRHRLSHIIVAIAGLAAFASPSASAAETYPSQMIRILVPSAAGTPPDILTRVIASELERSEGWRMMVENKPGAIQTIGAAEVLKQPADGHTLMSLALAASAASVLLPSTNIRFDRDFAPVIKLGTVPHVLVVHPAVPATSVSDLVALLKSQPDKLTFSSGGFGTPAHLAGELFKLRAHVRATHVPYRALPHAISDLLNGTNQYQFITPLPVLDLIASGKLRALAVTAPTRMPALKDVPTVVEEGFPELVIRDWIGYLVKSGTPDHIIARLNEAIGNALAKQHVRETFAKLAAEPAGGKPVEFGAFIAAQIAHWGKVVKDSGIKMPE